ncbi:MAG: hypothetical protein ACYCSQ_00315 [bacterium]
MNKVRESEIISIGGHFYELGHVEYRYFKTDAGRSSSKRPRQINDCTVRAVAMAFSISYDEAYDRLKSFGRKCGRGFHIDDYMSVAGAKKISFPAVKGEYRMNTWKFCREYDKGTYICRVAKHVFTVIDGVVCDMVPPFLDRCIYKAWEISK